MKERVKELRKALGMTQAEFGKRIEVTAGAIYFLEQGINRVNPRIVTVICKAFGVNRNWLVDGRGGMFDEDDATVLSVSFSMLDDSDKELVKKLIVSLARKNNINPPIA